MDAAAPVVLVHGAWHGSWCWDRVTLLLNERGIDVTAVDLPTTDIDAGYPTTVHDDAKTLRAALDALDRPAVVVGHSYGGMVISEGAADHPMVKHLIYLAAFMPDAGQSLNDLTAQVPNPAFGAALRFADGRTTLQPESVGALLYNDCDAETVRWATQRVQPWRIDLADAVNAAAWRAIPSTYVIGNQDKVILPALQQKMAQNADEIIVWDSSHSPFASQPSLVADLCERLARLDRRRRRPHTVSPSDSLTLVPQAMAEHDVNQATRRRRPRSRRRARRRRRHALHPGQEGSQRDGTA